MFIVSQIKNIKNILFVLLFIPTTNYSMLPESLIPVGSGITTIAIATTIITSVGIDNLKNSPLGAACSLAITAGTGFLTWKGSKLFTPENLLRQSNEKLTACQTKMSKGLFKTINEETQNPNEIIQNHSKKVYPLANFVDNNINPLLHELKIIKQSQAQISHHTKSWISSKLPDIATNKTFINENLMQQKEQLQTIKKTLNDIKLNVVQDKSYQTEYEAYIKSKGKLAKTMLSNQQLKIANQQLKDLNYNNSLFARIKNLFSTLGMQVVSMFLFQFIINAINASSVTPQQ